MRPLVVALTVAFHSLAWYGLVAGQAIAPRTPSQSTGVVERASAPLAAGAISRRVLVEADHATITVVGHDGSVVRAEARLDGDAVVDALGLRVNRAGGVVTVGLADDLPSGVHLVVEAPRSVALEVHAANGGPVTVVAVDGEVEVENSNAGIKLLDVVGPIVAATSNGPIEVRFRRVAPGFPMSFVTSNAPIDVTLPRDAGVELLVQTDTGSLRSELPIDRRDPEPGARFGPPAGPDPPRPGRVIRGSIGGGGPLFRFWTDNADVVIRGLRRASSG